MGYPLRSRDPSQILLVTIRTEGQSFFLRPSKKVNKIIGGILARYQEILKVEIFGFIVMSNHIHLVLRAPLGNLDEFMENVNREIARRINFKLNRHGRFWSRRYRAQVILSENDQEEALSYVLTNAVKHGGARHPSFWPGLSSYSQNFSEDTKFFPFRHYTEDDPDRRVTYHELKISPLPIWDGLTKKKRNAKLRRLLEARTAHLVEERELTGQGFMCEEQVRSTSPFEIPRIINRTSTGTCYSKDPVMIRNHKQTERQRRNNFKYASMRYRAGDMEARFPEYCFKPPLHRLPRIIPFTPVALKDLLPLVQ